MMNPDDQLDPVAAVRKKVVSGLTPDAAPDAPEVPVAPVPAPPVVPRGETPTLPTGPAPGLYKVPGMPAVGTPDAAKAPAQGGQFANSNQGFLDWATQKYGQSQSRGGGFVDAQAGGGLQKMAAEYAAATGNQAKFIGGPSGDQVDFGQGVQDALTSGGQIWNAAGGGAPGSGAGGVGGALGAAGGAGGAGSGNVYTDQIRTMLMDRIKRDQAPVNEQDNYINDPMAAARLEAGRSTDQERKALAERAYASGDLSGDSLRQGIQQSAERNAQGLGSMRAKLVAQEYASRRSDLNDAMQQALASGDSQMAREIQVALAQLNAQVQREGLGAQMAMFGQNQNVTTVNGANKP